MTNDLPRGYRWATEFESEHNPPDTIVVQRTADATGVPYTHGEADLAVPIVESTCRHCDRRIIREDGGWIDPEATGDDVIWRETCDGHDTFYAEHEPTTS